MGLLRTAARTAVITSTATRVHQRTAARQQGTWAAQQPAPAPPSPSAAPASASAPASRDLEMSSMIEQLTRLGELRTAGVLTEAEFEVQKHRILTGG